MKVIERRAIAPARFSRRPRTRLSRTRISPAPSSMSQSTMCEPIRPAPPVTSTVEPSSELLILQLAPQDGALEGVHPIVEADLIVVVALLLRVVAQRAQPSGDSVIVRDDGPTFSIGPQVLTGVEAEAAAEAEGSGALTAVL